jgi:hypothetical protein
VDEATVKLAVLDTHCILTMRSQVGRTVRCFITEYAEVVDRHMMNEVGGQLRFDGSFQTKIFPYSC